MAGVNGPEADAGLLTGKGELFTVACCRRIWHLLVDDASRNAVEVGERAADGLATESEQDDAYQAADDVKALIGVAFDERRIEPGNRWASAITAAGVQWFAATAAAEAAAALFDPVDPVDGPDAHLSAVEAAGWANATGDRPDEQAEANERATQAALVRDVFGNAFLPVDADPLWLTPGVLELARTIYDERVFDRLPQLADALEKGGCDNADILDHCRHPREHVRGCWVVDLIFGQRVTP